MKKILAILTILAVVSPLPAPTPTPTPVSKQVSVNYGTNALINPSAAAFYAANPPGTSGLPDQTGQSGKYLTTNGTVASWGTVSGSGSVTSVAATVPAFLSISGSPITTSGTLAFSLSGTALPVANGGTGITSFGSGIATFLGSPTSANLAAAVTGETGTGALVFGSSPTIDAPTLSGAINVTGAIGFTGGSIDLSSASDVFWAGSTDLTTLGIVTTGTWHATPIASSYGGFGADISASSGVPLFSSGTATFTSTSGTGNFVRVTAPAIVGGTHTALTGLGIRSTGAAFDLTLASSEVLTAGRTLTISMGDAARTLTFTGSPTLSGITTTGTGTLALGTKTLTVSNSLTLAGTDSTVMTFPSTSATIARTDAANTFTGTQTIGALVATTVNGNTISTGTFTLTGTAGKTLAFSNSLTLAGTDGTTMTFPGTSATIARTDAGNTFTGISTGTSWTLTTPVIASGLTASGSGANTFVGSTGTFITSSGANTLSGAVTVNDATTPSITLATGKTNTGFFLVNGKTSGGFKIIAADAAAQTVTLSLAAQTTGAATLTIPDQAGTNRSLVTDTGTQTLTNKSIADTQLTGAYTASGQTMATARLLGRTTASTGAAEEISVDSTLTLSAGTLSVTSAGAAVANPGAQLLGLTAINGSASTALRSDGAPALSQTIAPTWTGIHTFTPAARSSGVASYWKLTTPADTGITAATESVGMDMATGTRTWADGTTTTQREFLFRAPTYNKTTTSATFTTAATLAVSAAPIAGTGVTITNPIALWVQSGAARFQTGGFNNMSVEFGSPVFGLAQYNSSYVLVQTGSGNVGPAFSGGGGGVSNGVFLQSSHFVAWTNATDPTGTRDVGLSRSAAGVLEVDNGNLSPALRDLKLSHVLAGGTAPTIAAGTGAGTSPTVSVISGSQDLAGQVSVTAGVTPATASTVVTITYNRAFPTGSWVTLTPANAATALLSGVNMVFCPAGGTTTWTITSGSTALVATTVYLWNYSICGY